MRLEPPPNPEEEPEYAAYVEEVNKRQEKLQMYGVKKGVKRRFSCDSDIIFGLLVLAEEAAWGAEAEDGRFVFTKTDDALRAEEALHAHASIGGIYIFWI